MKKGQVPEAALILLVLAICVTSLYYAAFFKTAGASAINIDKVSKMDYDSKSYEIYAKDFASFALQQAYAEVVNRPVTCEQQLGLIPIWGEGDCKPNNQLFKNKLKENFDAKLGMGQSEIKDKLNVIIGKNYSISDYNKILFYNLSYDQTISFSLDYPAIDFGDIYSRAVTEKDKMTVDNWDVSVEESGNYYIFTLNSKKSYLYDNSFKPAELKFALQKTA